MDDGLNKYLEFDPVGELIHSTNKLRQKCKPTTPIISQRKPKINYQYTKAKKKQENSKLEILRSHSFDNKSRNTTHIQSNISNITIQYFPPKAADSFVKPINQSIIYQKEPIPSAKQLLRENSLLLKEITCQSIEIQSLTNVVNETHVRLKAVKQLYKKSIEDSFSNLLNKVLKAKESILLILDNRIDDLVKETSRVQNTLREYSISNQKIKEENSKYLNDPLKIKTMHSIYKEFIKKFFSDKECISKFLKGLCRSGECSIPEIDKICDLVDKMPSKCQFLPDNGKALISREDSASYFRPRQCN